MLESRLMKAVGMDFPVIFSKVNFGGSSLGGQHEQPRGRLPEPSGRLCFVKSITANTAPLRQLAPCLISLKWGFPASVVFFIGCFIRPCVMWGLKRSCKNIQKERPFFLKLLSHCLLNCASLLCCLFWLLFNCNTCLLCFPVTCLAAYSF